MQIRLLVNQTTVWSGPLDHDTPGSAVLVLVGDDGNQLLELNMPLANLLTIRDQHEMQRDRYDIPLSNTTGAGVAASRLNRPSPTRNLNRIADDYWMANVIPMVPPPVDPPGENGHIEHQREGPQLAGMAEYNAAYIQPREIHAARNLDWEAVRRNPIAQLEREHLEQMRDRAVANLRDNLWGDETARIRATPRR